MGGKSSSNSSSSQTTSSEENHNEVYAEREGTAVGANSNVTLTDFGVIEGAAAVLETGLGQMAGIVKDITGGFKEIVQDNNEILREQQESDVKEVGNTVLQGMMFMGLALVALVYLVLRKKK